MKRFYNKCQSKKSNNNSKEQIVNLSKMNKVIDSLDSNNDSSPYDALMYKGIYYITGEISDGDLLEIHQDILLKHMDPTWNDDVQLVINSVGGSVSEGMALIDLLDWVRMDVRTTAMGTCASMGACLACCGTHGKRGISPNTSVMIHGTTWGAFGTVSQVAAITKEMERDRERDIKFWIKHSKYKTPQEIIDNFLHDKNDIWMSADEALDHGIFDYIVSNKKLTTKPSKRKK